MSGDGWGILLFVALLGAHLTRVWRELRRERKIAAAKRQAEEHQESLTWFDELLKDSKGAWSTNILPGGTVPDFTEGIARFQHDMAGDTPSVWPANLRGIVPNDSRRVIDPCQARISSRPKNG